MSWSLTLPRRAHAGLSARDLPQPASAAGPAPPGLRARLSHRLARHLPLRTLAMRGGPMVSFTFDDVPQSALTAGADLLEAHGVFGTFYVAAGLLDATARNWHVIGPEGVHELNRRGHEIGCHTYAHVRADRLPGADLAAELRRNVDALHAIEPAISLRNFAYPFGYSSFAWKRRLAGAFDSCRGILPGINAGRIDPHFLRAMPLIDARIDRDGIARALDETRARDGWLVFYSHDVADRPSPYGCTPGLLAFALQAMAQRGIAGVSVAQAMQRLAADP